MRFVFWGQQNLKKKHLCTRNRGRSLKVREGLFKESSQLLKKSLRDFLGKIPENYSLVSADVSGLYVCKRKPKCDRDGIISV